MAEPHTCAVPPKHAVRGRGGAAATKRGAALEHYVGWGGGGGGRGGYWGHVGGADVGWVGGVCRQRSADANGGYGARVEGAVGKGMLGRGEGAVEGELGLSVSEGGLLEVHGYGRKYRYL